MNEDTRRIARMLALPAAVGLCGLLFSRFIRQGRFGDVLGVIFFRGEMVFWSALILAAALGSGLFLLKALRLRPD